MHRLAWLLAGLAVACARDPAAAPDAGTGASDAVPPADAGDVAADAVATVDGAPASPDAGLAGCPPAGAHADPGGGLVYFGVSVEYGPFEYHGRARVTRREASELVLVAEEPDPSTTPLQIDARVLATTAESFDVGDEPWIDLAGAFYGFGGEGAVLVLRDAPDGPVRFAGGDGDVLDDATLQAALDPAGVHVRVLDAACPVLENGPGYCYPEVVFHGVEIGLGDAAVTLAGGQATLTAGGRPYVVTVAEATVGQGLDQCADDPSHWLDFALEPAAE